MNATQNAAPATERQIAFISDLLRSIDPDNAPEAILALQQGDTEMSKAGASAYIEELIAKRDALRAEAGKAHTADNTSKGGNASNAGIITEGFYRAADGTIYQVFKARNGAYLLAKALLADGSWEYKGAAGRFVKASERMTLDDAKAYGKQTGRCMVCGRTLSNPESVAQGIGPVCSARF